MNRFEYVRPDTVADAVKALAGGDARALAGGTNLVDLMKYDVARPSRVVDINHLPLRQIEPAPDGGLTIGALVTNSELAWDRRITTHCPLLASAILAGASPQLRNAATTGGNLLQRTRCYYFYDPSTACNKREPGSGCSAIGGVNRIHAILGASDSCIAVHPSDMCVALAALEAVVNVEGKDGKRSIPFSAFHRLPGNEPQHDNTMLQGEKFDPTGEYVRRYVPELAQLPAKFIHRPFEAPAKVLEAAGVVLGETYPAPVLDHALGRERFLQIAASHLVSRRPNRGVRDCRLRVRRRLRGA